MAAGVRRRRRAPRPSRSSSTRSWRRPARRSSPTSSASTCSGPRCCASAPTSNAAATSRRSSRPRRSGARASRSPTPGRTSRRCERAPTSAATSSWSAGRRRGSRGDSSPAGAACWPARSDAGPKHRGISMLIVDMRSPGVELRPMTQITGHAEFCELFLDDVVVPRANLLGELGDGWKIAMHTLGHERGTAALPRQVKLRTWLDRAVRVAAERTVDGEPLIDDPGAQAALARALVGVEVLRHHAYRTVGEFLNGGAVGPDSSSVKLLMAEAEQRLAATALEVLGHDAGARRAGGGRRGRLLARDVPVLARRDRVRRHAADPAQHHRRPRPRPSTGVARMDLELSDEQRWLSEAVETRCSAASRARAAVGAPRRLRRAVGRRRRRARRGRAVPDRARARARTWRPSRTSAAPPCASRPRRWRRSSTTEAVALAVLEPGSSWAAAPIAPGVEPVAGGHVVTGRKTAVEHAGAVARLAVVAAAPQGPALAIVDAGAPGVALVPQPAFDPTAPMYAVELVDAPVVSGPLGGEAVPPDGDDRAAAGGRRGGRSGRAHARGRVPLRRRAAPVRPHDRQLPGAAPPAGRHVRAPGQLVVVGPLRGGRARRGRRRGGTDGVDRQGVRVARGPRGRARRDAGVRRHRRHGGASGPPVPAPDRRARAAVRRCGPPRARARARARAAAVPEPVG